jgi:hypothetical protein
MQSLEVLLAEVLGGLHEPPPTARCGMAMLGLLMFLCILAICGAIALGTVFVCGLLAGKFGVRLDDTGRPMS